MNLTVRKAAASAASALTMAGGLAVVGTTVTAAPASAGTPCSESSAGKTRKVFGRGAHQFVLTEAYRVEVPRGGGYSEAVKFSRTVTKTNSVKLSAEVSTKFSAGIFAEAEAKFGGEYGHVNTKTELSETTKTWTFGSPGVYYVARGLETFKIPVTLQRCRRPSVGSPEGTFEWISYAGGNVTGWGRVDGAARCNGSYSGDFRAFVKARRC